MSGGYFDYCQFKMDAPIEKLTDMLQSPYDTLDADAEVIHNVSILLHNLTLSRECLHILDKFLCADIGREEFLEGFKNQMEIKTPITQTNITGADNVGS